jgi:hypothetical protein
LEVYQARLDAMRLEIEALAADKTASNDSDCGFVRYVAGEGTCGAVDLVYSRATVDEDLLLEKVQEYNELVATINTLSGYDYLMFPVCTVAPQPANVKVVGGVCAASY